jgi:hypothetical protein
VSCTTKKQQRYVRRQKTRKEIGKRFFLIVYTKQRHPLIQPSEGAGIGLIREENGELSLVGFAFSSLPRYPRTIPPH